MMIRDYVIKEKIGTGSYGVVYKVIKKGDDKNILVLKQISLFGLTKKQIEDVRAEAEILSKLNYHYIVKYHDSFEEKNFLNIVMEYCDDGDLDGLINKTKEKNDVFEEVKIWKLFLQICLGLGYLHKKNVLHRDLKSLNIFLTKDRGIKIGDLGVAKLLTQGNFAKTFIGTPYYLSPEICEEKPYNIKSDVWALGCILYEMCTFKHPFDARSQGALILKIVKGKFEPVGNKYSDDINSLVNFLLQKNEDKRPNVQDILKASYVMKKIKQFNMMGEVIELFPDLGKSDIPHGVKMRELSMNEVERLKKKNIVININLTDKKNKGTKENKDTKGTTDKKKGSATPEINSHAHRQSGNYMNKKRPNLVQESPNVSKENSRIGPVTNSFHKKNITKNIENFEKIYQKNMRDKEMQKEYNNPKSKKSNPSCQFFNVKDFPDKDTKLPKQSSNNFKRDGLSLSPDNYGQKKSKSPYEIGSDLRPESAVSAIKRIKIIDKPSSKYMEKQRQLFNDNTSVVDDGISMTKLIKDYLPNKTKNSQASNIKKNAKNEKEEKKLQPNDNTFFHKPIPIKDTPSGADLMEKGYQSSNNLPVKNYPPTISYDNDVGKKVECQKLCYNPKKTYKTIEEINKESADKKETKEFKRSKGKPKPRQSPKYVSEDNFTDSDNDALSMSRSEEENKSNQFSDEENSDDKETVEVSKPNRSFTDSDSGEVEEKAICLNEDNWNNQKIGVNNEALKLLEKKKAIEQKINNTKNELIKLIGKEATDFVLKFYKNNSNSNSIEDIEDENTCESIEFEIHKKFPDKLEDFKRIFYLLISNDIQLESIKEEIAKAQ